MMSTVNTMRNGAIIKYSVLFFQISLSNGRLADVIVIFCLLYEPNSAVLRAISLFICRL